MVQKLKHNTVLHSKIKNSSAMKKLRNMKVFNYDVSVDKLDDLDFEISKILLDVSAGEYCYFSNLPVSWESAVLRKKRSAIKRRPSNKCWKDPVYLLGRPPLASSSRLVKNSVGKKEDNDPSPTSHFSLELSDENKKTEKKKIKRDRRSELEEKVYKLTEYQEALKVAVKKVRDRCEELQRENIELKKLLEEEESLLPTDHQEALDSSIIRTEELIDNRLEEPEEAMATAASAQSPQEDEKEEESIKISQSQPSNDDRTAMDVDLLSVDQMGARMASQRRPSLFDLNKVPLDEDEEEVVEFLDCLMSNKAAACEEERRRGST